MRVALFALLPLLLAAEPPSTQFLDFVKLRAKEMRANDKPPTSLDEWKKQRVELRAKLVAAWGGFPEKPRELDVQKHGELKRDGYTVEKISFQTLPGVRMTANAYVPDKKGKLPAILQVHGHWKGAKQDPVVQSRCIGAAKLGFFVLCVDAFGAGERGIGKALGEYHGEMVGALLFPIGKPLSGIQVYENSRAVDYLLTRPEVDGDKIGITGASGGGNQTMYAAAMDERLKAAVPVCSVGNYQAYLGAACCMCEVVPGALSFTEESGLLAMVAPRALMIVSATRDAPQFSVDAAKVSIKGAMPMFQLHGKEKSLQHAIFESGHDYSKPMREAMYGFMTQHLKGEGDGGPVKELEFKTEEPESLRCYPGETRPDHFVTLPKFAEREARKLLAERKEVPAQTRQALLRVLWHIDVSKPEPKKRSVSDQPLAVVIRFGAEKTELETALVSAGWNVELPDLRATGANAVLRDAIGRAPDHNSAEWSLWLGRPLLVHWVSDVKRRLDSFEKLPKNIIVIGEGPAGLIALAAAAIDPRITKAVAINSLASFVSDVPYEKQRLGLMAPGILRDVGDVGHIAALAKKVIIVGGVNGGGKALSLDELKKAYQPAKNVKIAEKMTTAELLKALE